MPLLKVFCFQILVIFVEKATLLRHCNIIPQYQHGTQQYRLNSMKDKRILNQANQFNFSQLICLGLSTQTSIDKQYIIEFLPLVFMSSESTPILLNLYKNSSISQTKQSGYQSSEACKFLTSSISGMIKKQLKTYRLHKKMQNQVLDYKKNKQKKQFVSELHKVQKFRSNQTQNQQKKFEDFIKLKKQKENKIQSLIQMKEQQIKTKTIEANKKFLQVKKRHDLAVQQEISTRLSRAESFQHSNSKLKSANLSSSKASFRCQSSLNNRNLIKERSQSQQKLRITNYLKKMKNAQSRILQKQIKNQGRKIKSLQTQVKKLTATRDANQESLKQKYQDSYNTKMSSFYSKMQNIQLQNSTFMMNKSMLRSKLREKVIKNKQMNDSQLFSKTITNFMTKTNNGSQKQNFCNWNSKKLDMLRSQSNFMNNSIKMQREALYNQNQKNMRIVYAKVQRLKMMSDNQKISQKQKEQILNLINPNGPQYLQIAEFLSFTKSQYLKKQIQKQEQKLNKMKKSGRNTKSPKC